jgi:hypothetical protein
MGQVVGPLSSDRARSIFAGDAWIDLEPAELPGGSAPLRTGQFLDAGGELRIVLEVGERCVRVAPLEDDQNQSEDIWQPRQHELGDGWHRLK